MIPYNEFYSAFLSNHFKVKSRVAAHLLNLGVEEIGTLASQVDLDVNDIEFLKTIKIDLIQTFYQSVESLFGLMLSLEDIESNIAVPDYLVNAGISDQHKFIRSFEDYNYCYQYLLSTILDKTGREVPKYQWLFYFVTLFVKDVPQEFIDKMQLEDNIKGIAHTLNSLAKLFNKEAHNSIKHGLRCLIVGKLNIEFNLPEGFSMPAELSGVKDAEDILMYYTKGPVKNGPATVVLVPIDLKYIIYLEDGNSKLLFNMISLRQIVFGADKPEEVRAHFFSYERLKQTIFPAQTNFESIRVDAAIE